MSSGVVGGGFFWGEASQRQGYQQKRKGGKSFFEIARLKKAGALKKKEAKKEGRTQPTNHPTKSLVLKQESPPLVGLQKQRSHILLTGAKQPGANIRNRHTFQERLEAKPLPCHPWDRWSTGAPSHVAPHRIAEPPPKRPIGPPSTGLSGDVPVRQMLAAPVPGLSDRGRRRSDRGSRWADGAAPVLGGGLVAPPVLGFYGLI